MFRVWWLQEALDDVAAQWIGADAGLRQAITEQPVELFLDTSDIMPA